MITFGYMAGYGREEKYMGAVRRSPNLLTFVNQVKDELSFCGIETWKNKLRFLADFDGLVYITGHPPETLPTLIKQFQAMGLPLSSKRELRMWNDLIFDLYPSNSILKTLLAGEIRGSGLTSSPKPAAPAGQRLYGGHLIINRLDVELSISLTSINIQSQLLEDLNLGLQALLAIMSNMESADLILGAWRLTLRPGMLYEEIFNGRDS